MSFQHLSDTYSFLDEFSAFIWHLQLSRWVFSIYLTLTAFSMSFQHVSDTYSFLDEFQHVSDTYSFLNEFQHLSDTYSFLNEFSAFIWHLQLSRWVFSICLSIYKALAAKNQQKNSLFSLKPDKSIQPSMLRGIYMVGFSIFNEFTAFIKSLRHLQKHLQHQKLQVVRWQMRYVNIPDQESQKLCLESL